MSICYVVLAHAKPLLLAGLLHALDEPGNRVVVHVDARTDIDPFRQAAPDSERIAWVDDRVRPYHHGWGIVDATLRALRLGTQAGADRYVLLSGDSYPLRSSEYIAEFFARRPRTEWMNLLPLPAPQVLKDLDKLRRYHIHHDPRGSQLIAFGAKAARRLVPRRNWKRALGDLAPYCGSQWWALSADAVAHLLAQIDARPEYVRFCHHSQTPDEHFFHTLLANSPLHPRIRPSVMFADFSVRPGPAMIRRAHVERWIAAGRPTRDDEYGHHEELLFARKFDAQSPVELLHETLWRA